MTPPTGFDPYVELTAYHGLFSSGSLLAYTGNAMGGVEMISFSTEGNSVIDKTGLLELSDVKSGSNP